MTQRNNVTEAAKSVTEQRDTSRARTPSFGGNVTLSRCHAKRDVTHRERDSDSTACRPTRHHHEAAPSIAKKPMTWLHIAAMNLIADHEAGIPVGATNLEAARRLMAA